MSRQEKYYLALSLATGLLAALILALGSQDWGYVALFFVLLLFTVRWMFAVGRSVETQVFVPRAVTGVSVPEGSIIEAVMCNDLEAAKTLILGGQNITERDERLRTALHFAAGRGHRELAKLLIERGAKVNAKDGEGNTPLASAVSGGHEDLAVLLISRGAAVRAKLFPWGRTLLHYARSTQFAEFLISKGVNIDAKSNYGETPLHCAQTNEVAELLIAKGADILRVETQWKGRTPLHRMSECGFAGATRLILLQGGDVHARDKDGEAPLHMAVTKEIAGLLIAHGAMVDARDHKGNTPLHLAASANRKDVVAFLIEQGAEVNARANAGYTPLHSAAGVIGGADIAQLLIDHGADVRVRDEYGQTPLHKVWTEAVAETLILNGADLDARNIWGGTPLTVAVENELHRIASLLRSHGAMWRA